MKTLAELLREADPLGREPRWSPKDRLLSRQAVLDARPAPDRPRPRTPAIACLAGLALVATAFAGFRLWSGAAIDVHAAVRFEVRLAEERPAPGLREARVGGSDRRIYLHPEAVVTNTEVVDARAVQGDDASTFSVSVTFTPEGAARMAKATEGHLGRPLAILLDGEVAAAPVVRSSIGGAAVITGKYTREEAEKIVAGIRRR
jgi:hypothetical protein